MFTLTAIAMTCWICALIATPRKPLLDNEIQELVYARLLGRHQRLLLVALVITAVTFIALVAKMPHRLDRNINSIQAEQQVCYDAPMQRPTCYIPRPDGMWVVEQMQDDGTWLTEDLVSHPPSSDQGGFGP